MINEEDRDKTNGRSADTAFRAGEEIVLVGGNYRGTPGIFLRHNADSSWADIEERNGEIRSHPIAWMGRPVVGPVK